MSTRGIAEEARVSWNPLLDNPAGSELLRESLKTVQRIYSPKRLSVQHFRECHNGQDRQAGKSSPWADSHAAQREAGRPLTPLWLLLPMAAHRAGKPDEAKKLLAQLTESVKPEALPGWQLRLEFLVLS